MSLAGCAGIACHPADRGSATSIFRGSFFIGFSPAFFPAKLHKNYGFAIED
jgi:hypothetical protein